MDLSIIRQELLLFQVYVALGLLALAYSVVRNNLRVRQKIILFIFGFVYIPASTLFVSYKTLDLGHEIKDEIITLAETYSTTLGFLNHTEMDTHSDELEISLLGDLQQKWLKANPEIHAIKVIKKDTSEFKQREAELETVLLGEKIFLPQVDRSENVESYSAFVPIKNKKGDWSEILQVELTRDQYLSRITPSLQINLLSMFVFYLVCLFVYFSFIKTENAIIVAEELAAKKSIFTATVSHELRTPLNGIIGAVNLVKSTSLNAEQKMYMNLMSDCSQALLALINDVLDFSKMESQKLTIERSPFNPHSVLERLVAMQGQAAREKGISLVLYSEDETKWVYGDPTRFFQVVMNLIGNAIKFTEKGKVEVIVKWQPEYEADQDRLKKIRMILEVVDTGIGMNESQKRKLFNPYEQGDSSITRRFGGTGLGLVITKNLIELMSGRIDVKSYEGLGSTFTVDILFDLVEENLIPKMQNQLLLQAQKNGFSKDSVSVSNPVADLIVSEKSPVEDAVRFSDLKILICDDVQVNLVILRKTLEKLGYRCEAAENGQVCLDKMAEQNFDILFLDCQMPVLDGYETARRLRQQEQYKKLKIVALTANTSAEDRQKCLDSGMDDFMSKPFNVDRLKELLVETENNKINHAS